MKLVVLTAPSGSGKTTIARRLEEEIPDLEFSVSATTRDPRPGEEDGSDYYFLSEGEFRERIEQGAFVEYEEVYEGQYYGTLKTELERQASDHPVLLDIDVRGALTVKSHFGDAALCIFIRPPSLQELARRLRGRGTETEEDLARRIERARTEMGFAERFDVTVVNDDLEEAVGETLRHVRSFIGD